MKKIRVMWLLNHTTARKFEIPMLKAMGVEEIFLPKIMPNEIAFRSTSIDYSEDANLSINKEELKILNETDWYGVPSQAAWAIANKYFDVLFFILYRSENLPEIMNNFEGAIVWRQYGFIKSATPTQLFNLAQIGQKKISIEKICERFWCGLAYEHLHDYESKLFQRRKVYLPLGLPEATVYNDWSGLKKKILFVCPDIAVNPYYAQIYSKFKEDFANFEYLIGGHQAIPSEDPKILGFLPIEEHECNMRELRVMFYHSQEPNHIHYHPFQAIQRGMPLVFMAGGLLDRLGGKNLPGRCKTIKEAQRKIRKILNDDWSFIEKIRDSQKILLEPMKFENCIESWQVGFRTILSSLKATQQRNAEYRIYFRPKKKRIAVLIPVGYRGGSLRGAKVLAEAIYYGSQQAGEEAEVIFGHLNLPDLYCDEDFLDLHPAIKRRPYQWKILDQATASTALLYAKKSVTLVSPFYQAPDDGINYFQDCNLLVIISDRIDPPILPLYPYITMIYDYLQRYEYVLEPWASELFIKAAHAAEKVLVTTEFARQDALQFAGLPEDKVCKVPILTPDFSSYERTMDKTISDYFLWTTNLAPHKNHVNALKALAIYYGELNGQLKCYMCGVDTDKIMNSQAAYLKSMPNFLDMHPKVKEKLKIIGEQSDANYKMLLAKSAFLWHPARMDNGTLASVEAAYLNVPVLSSDYPPMREYNADFNLNLMWMDPWDPRDMAKKLKQMELEMTDRYKLLPTVESLKNCAAEKQAHHYWNAIKDCL